MKILYRSNDTLQVFSLSTTTNAKIVDSNRTKIVQTYTFSKKQYELIANKTNDGMKTFFSNADTNCLDCPFNSFGKCYTHKFNQYVGFISMLKSIVKTYPKWDDIPTINRSIERDIVSMSIDKYIRFGTYGEPSMHPIQLINRMCVVSKNWTGYTHQWQKKDLGKVFMSSVHSEEEESKARSMGYRSFVVNDEDTTFVKCPASKEAGNKSTCSSCNLCSGTEGTKSKKSIHILTH